MMKELYCLFVLIVLFNGIQSDSGNETACAAKSGTDCGTCLSVKGCAFCKDSKLCFYYDTSKPAGTQCNINQMQWETCVGSFQVWIIVVAVLGGIVLLVILIVICCLCRKCKQCKIRRIERREERDEQRMEERRAAAEVRTTERNRVAEQIRMKYGMLKDKDNNTDYTRMN